MRVFVTTELYPFTAGGIGRVIANVLVTSTPEERARTIIVMIESAITQAQFNSVYPDVRFMSFDDAAFDRRCRDGQYPPRWAYTNTIWHWRSMLALHALVEAESLYGDLDYVEFPDWGGLAFASAQHKLLGLGLQRSRLAIRLHSTDAIITEHEARDAAEYNLSLFDLERKALADVDMVIGQLAPVAEAVRRFYGFDAASWASRLHIHAPPVLVDRGHATHITAFAADTPLVFTSKLQHVKRPDVFVRGCVGFMRAVPEYRGKVLFLAHANDDAYAARFRRMIPAELESRFEFVHGLPSVGREHIISAGVCIFANAWESFCLAAYEAGLLGARCVMNGSAVAFGEDVPWIDGTNCHKFDGTPAGLARTLEDAYRSGGGVAEVVALPQDTPPWASLTGSLEASPAPCAASALPRVSVIVPHFNLGQYLLSTIDSVLASDYPNLEIVIVDDASTDAWSQHIVERVDEHAGVDFKVVRNTTNIGLPAARNVALAHCTGDYVLPLDADDLIHPGFIGLAVRALQAHRDFDFVVPQVAFFHDGEEWKTGAPAFFGDYAIFHGEARYSGLFENRYSTASMLIRADVLREFRYREALDSYEDWDLYQRLTQAGRRSIATNAVQFFYRRRAQSMIHGEEARARRNIHRHDLLRGKRLADFGDMPAFVMAHAIAMRDQAPAAAPPVAVAHGLHEADAHALAEYRSSETVFAALTVAKALHRHAPWLLDSVRWGMRLGWRMAKGARRAMTATGTG